MRARNAEILEHVAERPGSAGRAAGRRTAFSSREGEEEGGREVVPAPGRGESAQAAHISLEDIDANIRTHQDRLQKMVRACRAQHVATHHRPSRWGRESSSTEACPFAHLPICRQMQEIEKDASRRVGLFKYQSLEGARQRALDEHSGERTTPLEARSESCDITYSDVKKTHQRLRLLHERRTQIRAGDRREMESFRTRLRIALPACIERGSCTCSGSDAACRACPGRARGARCGRGTRELARPPNWRRHSRRCDVAVVRGQLVRDACRGRWPCRNRASKA